MTSLQMQECCAEAHRSSLRTHCVGLLGSQMCRSDLLIEDMLMQAVDAALVDVRTSSRRLAIEAVCSLHRDIGLALTVTAECHVECLQAFRFVMARSARGLCTTRHQPSGCGAKGASLFFRRFQHYQHGSSNQSTCPREDCLVHGTVRADDNIFECGLLPGREYVHAQLLS